MESVGRIFVAVGFPPEVRAHLGQWLEPLELAGRIVPAEDLHLTVRFLGELDAVALDRLSGALDQSDLIEPFSIRLDGLGAFPHARKASVIWIGVDDQSGRLGLVHTGVEDACEEAGLGRDERPFRPHVTVSRCRPPADVRAIMSTAPPLGISTPVDHVVVLRSHLGAGAGRYEAVERFDLG
ncbi:MAG TPA: RNA 2',3'-cyclic phosphodiesterase [Acidimicrobiia bacterium]|nr:RNA 2',3'-cyclic phosphodiesterase [Acidimicrobiia bacterium]